MTPTDTRTTARARRRRVEILDTAVRHFNRSGLSGATLAEIAADAGLVTNGIAYYYRRKEDLAAACLIRSIETISELIETALAAPGPAPLRLNRLCAAWFSRLADGEAGRAPPVMRFDDIRALMAPHSDHAFSEYNQMYRSLRRVFDDTPVASCPVARNARTHLLLAIFHAAQQWFDLLDPDDHAQVAARLAAMLSQGLAPGTLALTRRLESCEDDRPALWPDPPADPAHDPYLRAATRLINLHGYRGASVERISAELNLTKGAFYHHMQTKDALVIECFERSFAILRSAQDKGFSCTGTGLQRLARTVDALLAFQRSADGPMLRISAFNTLPEDLRTPMRNRADRLVQRFGWLLTDAQADGTAPVHDPILGARVLHSMLNALCELDWWVPGAEATPAMIDYATGLFDGLFCPPAGGAAGRSPPQPPA